MCCFSGAVERVSATNIFARAAGPRQVLVYEMRLATAREVAMILPLPVPPQSAEDAVRFIDLSTYRDLFAHLKRGFPEPVSRGMSFGAIPGGFQAQSLAVVSVGDFEASFVPTIADFERLDPRFRLPPAAWDALPAYRDFGFAVFKLKPGATTIHPMALSFPRRDPTRLFFPTVHVHDGAVHAGAHFDHSLYAQPDDPAFDRPYWRRSTGPAHTFVEQRAPITEVLDLMRDVHLCRIEGTYANQDVVI
jgi:hypothetical protein